MGQIKWYKRDPDAALSGMMGLSLEERGAYNTVLDLIYTRDGNLPDDERFIAGWLGVDVRVWRRIKDRLMKLGKLYLSEGQLRNKRADAEVSNALTRVGSARDAGHASARSKARKSEHRNNKNSDLDETPVETGDGTGVPTNHNHNHNQREEPDGSSPPAPQGDGDADAPPAPLKHLTGKDWPEIPDWVPIEPWNAFVTMRRRKKANPTDRAVKMLIRKLEDLQRSGCDPGDVLDQSTLKNWTDLYEIEDQRNGTDRNQATGRAFAGDHRGRARIDGTTAAINDALANAQSRHPAGAAGRRDLGDGDGIGELPIARVPAVR